MKYARTTSYSRRIKIDVEPWELLALNPLAHWCFVCHAMRRFEQDEPRNRFYCAHCHTVLPLQQLIIEGRLSEGKYRGIESA